MADALDPSIIKNTISQTNQFGTGFFIPHTRSIGGILADVTIEETERDEITITAHPVEQGAPITDHAFKNQSDVTIRCGWNLQNSGDLSAESGIYGIILNWQAAFVPFDLYTGKRKYQNMLIASIIVTTDQMTEYSLMATLVCREVILTKTKELQTAVSDTTTNHSSPATTATPTDLGTREPKILDPTDPSAQLVTNIGPFQGAGADIGSSGQPN